MSIPITHCEKLGYQVKYSIFNCAYKAAKKTNHSRIPAFFALGAYGLTGFTAQIASTAELTFRGLDLVFSSTTVSEENTRGWQMLKQTPKQGGKAILVVLVSLINLFVVAFDPKFYILSNTAQARVDFDHLQAGTIDSEDHEIDSEESIGKVKSSQFQ